MSDVETKSKVVGLYWIYIILGICYVLIKIGFVSFGYLHLTAILHGAIPASLTAISGYITLSLTKKRKSSMMNILLMVLPILTVIITPIYMYIAAGPNVWLTKGRLPVLIIYEIIGTVQFIVAVIAFKRIRNM